MAFGRRKEEKKRKKKESTSCQQNEQLTHDSLSAFQDRNNSFQWCRFFFCKNKTLSISYTKTLKGHPEANKQKMRATGLAKTIFVLSV
jgi:hypothetical protein